MSWLSRILGGKTEPHPHQPPANITAANIPSRLRKPALVAFGNKCDHWIARMKDTMPPGSILVKAHTAGEIRLPQVVLSPCGLIFDHFVPGYKNRPIPESKVRQWLLDFEERIDAARNRAGKPLTNSVTDISLGSVAMTFSWREGVAAQVCAAFAVELESIYTQAKSGGSPPQKTSQVQDAKPASAPPATLNLWNVKENRWVPARCREIIGVGVKADAPAMTMLNEKLILLVNQMVPGFSSLANIRTTTHQVKTGDEGVKLITENALHQNLNVVIVGMHVTLSAKPVETWVAVLVSTESVKRPQITLCETVNELHKFLRISA